VVLAPLLKGSGASIDATNESIQDLAQLDELPGVKNLIDKLQTEITALQPKSLRHMFTMVVNISPKELRTTETELDHSTGLPKGPTDSVTTRG